MPVTPDEIRGQIFRSTVRGFDRQQVKAFLERVATDYEGAIGAIAQATSQTPERDELRDLLRSARESTLVLRQVAELESRIASERTPEEQGIWARYLMSRSATLLEQAIGLLERAHGNARPERTSGAAARTPRRVADNAGLEGTANGARDHGIGAELTPAWTAALPMAMTSTGQQGPPPPPPPYR
jgi:DivIVA domain-containing protein